MKTYQQLKAAAAIRKEQEVVVLAHHIASGLNLPQKYTKKNKSYNKPKTLIVTPEQKAKIQVLRSAK
jgi:hypothetical protein